MSCNKRNLAFPELCIFRQIEGCINMCVTAKHILHNSHAIAKRIYYCNKTHVTKQQNTYFYDNSHVIRDVNPKSEMSIQNLKIDEPLPSVAMFFVSSKLDKGFVSKTGRRFLFFWKNKIMSGFEKKSQFQSWPKPEHSSAQDFAVVSIGYGIGASAWSYYIRVVIKINVQQKWNLILTDIFEIFLCNGAQWSPSRVCVFACGLYQTDTPTFMHHVDACICMHEIYFHFHTPNIFMYTKIECTQAQWCQSWLCTL